MIFLQLHCPRLPSASSSFCSWTKISSNMSVCAAKERCCLLDLPLPASMKHFCASCEKEMHGCCGIFNGNDSEITSCNCCHDCDEQQFVGKNPSIKLGIILKCSGFTPHESKCLHVSNYVPHRALSMDPF